MKKLICIFLLISIIMLSSCSSLGIGSSMPELETYTAFEDETWLVISRFLINKNTGSVCMLEANTDADMPDGVYSFYYYGPYAYRYEFEESSINEYTFLKTATAKNGERFYCECVLTYSYEGNEIERSYIGEPLTEDEMKAAYKTNPSNTNAFPFEIDMIWDYEEEEYENDAERSVIKYAEEIYKAQSDKASTVLGLARPKGDKIRFSLTVSKDRHYNSGAPLFGGIHQNEIRSYDPATNEFETVYEYNKNGIQIIDLDENGMYILDPNGNFSYISFESETPTLIHKFSEKIYSFYITDKYICADYGTATDGELFVYEKGGSVIADDQI